MKKSLHLLFCLSGCLLPLNGFAEQYIVDSWCFGTECPAGNVPVEFDMVGTAIRPGVSQNGSNFTTTCDADPNLGFQEAIVNFGYALNRAPYPNIAFDAGDWAGNSKALMVKDNSMNPMLATFADVVGDGNPNVRIEVAAKVRASGCRPISARPLFRINCFSQTKFLALMDAQRWQPGFTEWRRQFDFSGVAAPDGSGFIATSIWNVNLNECDADMQLQTHLYGMSSATVDRLQVTLWRDR